jgi:hypothetical protein
MMMWLTYLRIEEGKMSEAEDRIADMSHKQLKKAMLDSLILRDMVRIELAKRVRKEQR